MPSTRPVRRGAGPRPSVRAFGATCVPAWCALCAALALTGALAQQTDPEPDVPEVALATETAAPAPEEIVPPAPSPIPDDATLERLGAVIGDVVIRAGDIFNPELPQESNRVFRAANKLHPVTRERVIRQLLLFGPGTPYSRRLLDETERLLRDTPYLYDATCRPIRYEDGSVTVEVVTRDVWTLRLGIGYSRSGGENSTRLGLSDANFLGSGKEILARRITDVDRTSYQYRYRDPNVFGSRVRMELAYRDNSDGSFQGMVVERPFYALDARWSAGMRVSDDDRVDRLYDLGEIVEEFGFEQHRFDLYWGRSSGDVGRNVRRWQIGVSYEQDLFAPAPNTLTPASLPAGRTLSYPWVAFDWINDGFIEVHDLDRIKRTEDLNLGHELSARAGWSLDVLDGEPGVGLFRFGYRLGASPGRGQILLASGRTSGRLKDGRWENLTAGVGLRYYMRDLGGHVFFVRMNFDAIDNPDFDRQLLLGGDSGLRGFPLRYLEGERRMLITLEQRFYTDWHLLQLVHVGAAVFFDMGKVWHRGISDTEDGFHHDVGFGLRIGSSRSSSAAMVHVDVAFPLTGDDSISRVQFLINSRETF